MPSELKKSPNRKSPPLSSRPLPTGSNVDVVPGSAVKPAVVIVGTSDEPWLGVNRKRSTWPSGQVTVTMCGRDG